MRIPFTVFLLFAITSRQKQQTESDGDWNSGNKHYCAFGVGNGNALGHRRQASMVEFLCRCHV